MPCIPLSKLWNSSGIVDTSLSRIRCEEVCYSNMMKLFQTIQKRSSEWSAPLQTKPAPNPLTTPHTESDSTRGRALVFGYRQSNQSLGVGGMHWELLEMSQVYGRWKQSTGMWLISNTLQLLMHRQLMFLGFNTSNKAFWQLSKSLSALVVFAVILFFLSSRNLYVTTKAWRS